MLRTPFPLPVCPPPYSQGSKAGKQRDFNAQLYNDFWSFSVDKASQLLEQKEQRRCGTEGFTKVYDAGLDAILDKLGHREK